jgi:type II secretory pathway component GspD/PulD (secretin)
MTTLRAKMALKPGVTLTSHLGCIIFLGIFAASCAAQGLEATRPQEATASEAAAESQKPPAAVPSAAPGGAAPQVPGAPGPAAPQAGFPLIPPPPAREGMPPIATPRMAVRPAAMDASRKGQFTLNFDDADVFSIIQTVFGEILKANYVIDPRVKGRVTFRSIAPVPVENVLPLMEVILRLNGIGIVEDNHLFRIVPISDISKEPSPVSFGRDPEKIPVTGKALLQVVPIVYVQSAEALKLITPFASNNAVLIDVPKGNQIIIVDTDSNVRRMLSLIEVFDNERLKQRKPQVFVYQVQNSKAMDIATLLQQIFTGGKQGAMRPSTVPRTTAGENQPAPTTPTVSAPAPAPRSQVPSGTGGEEVLVADFTKIIADEITNTIVVLATPEDYATISRTIEQIDIVPRQVIIEGMIASVSLTDNLSLGLAALFKGSVSGFNTSIGLNTTGLIDVKGLTQAGFTFLATDAAGIVRGLLTALAEKSKAKVLASPHILVSDNRDAKFQVGQQVPLLTSETYGTAGVSPQRNYQYKDIGIILKVKPRINQGGLVSLDISQEISTSEKIALGDTEQLLINKTEATTNLVVQDGQTIVIGGLIREDTTKGATGIPWLSQIPFLGWLFGSTTDDTKRQELIILLTPRVIKNQKEAKTVSESYIDNMSDASQERIRKDELMRKKPAEIPQPAVAPPAK